MKKSYLLLLFALTACAPRGDGSYSRASLGMLTGAVVGGVVGSQFGAGSGKTWLTTGGALYGAAVGSDWGASVDRMQLQNKTRSADGVFEYLPDETYKAWIDPNTGRTSTIRPLQTTYQPDGQPCRAFQTTRAGHSAIGMVCRDSYGRWRIID